MPKKKSTVRPIKVKKAIRKFRSMSKDVNYLQEIDSVFSSEGLPIIQMCVFRAKKGDAICLKLCVDYIVSRLRSVSFSDLNINVKDIASLDGIAATNAHVLKSVVSGDLSVDHGKSISSILQAQQHMIMDGELEKRMEALEAALKRDLDGC